MADKLMVLVIGGLTLVAFGVIVIALSLIAAPAWIKQTVRRKWRPLAAVAPRSVAQTSGALNS